MKIPIRSADDSPQSEGPQSEGLQSEGLHDTAPEVPEGSSAPVAEPAVAPPAAEAVQSEARLQELEAALAEKTQEYEATHEQLLRLMAEFDNYRKRMTRQQEEARQLAMADLVIALLPGLDNLQRALSAARQDAAPSSAAIAEGVSMVLRHFQEALAKVGVHEVQTQGQPFDPTRHEAVDTVHVPASEDGLIVEEVQRGYLLRERLLRPAKVIVGKAEADVNAGGA
jgi:molecular chaperone GrpE